jgi:hypothetical protein
LENRFFVQGREVLEKALADRGFADTDVAHHSAC